MQERLGFGVGGGRRDACEDLECLSEAAAPGMEDEVDGPTTAAGAQVIVELGAVDAEDGAGSLPARPVAGIAAVSECCCDALQGDAPECVGLERAARLHGPSSVPAAATCSVVTVRAFAAAAAWSA